MAPWIIQIALVAMSILTETTEGKKDTVLYCSACRAIVDELNYSISQIDPKKTIHVGGFRLNPDGSLTDKKVPLARSEANLSELLDGVCGSMSDYALHVDPDTKIKQYKRFAPRSSDAGDFPDFNNFKFDGPEGSNALKFVVSVAIIDSFTHIFIHLFSLMLYILQSSGDIFSYVLHFQVFFSPINFSISRLNRDIGSRGKLIIMFC
uniref:Canopy FGF signaling regulator 1 n=1 Tax=Oncorhynchus mykiss TaxID=8022 RepID=A0A8K9V2A3_ONCMY